MLTDALVAFDHLKHTVTILANAYVEEDGVERRLRARARRDREVRERLAGPLPAARAARVRARRRSSRRTCRARRSRRWSPGSSSTSTPATRSRSSRRSAGRREVEVDPFSIYRGLRAINPSPYMYFLDFEDFQIVGASPEPLVTVTGGRATTRPIAGTRPRGGDAEEDEAIAEDLLADEKERAEHVMLVDLGRNDLGRVCEYGTRRGRDVHGRRDLLAPDAHRLVASRGRLRPERRPDGRAALDPPRGHAVAARRRSARCRSSTSSSRSSAAPTAARSATSPTRASSTPASASAPS